MRAPDFALNTRLRDLFDGAYMEHSILILTGNILLPPLEKAGKDRIQIADDSRMDDYCKPEPSVISAKAIGWREIPIFKIPGAYYHLPSWGYL